MNRWNKISFVVLLVCLFSTYCFSNVYVVIYATYNGKTGHAGIAIDNYDFVSVNSATDTIANGTLTYFDLWPSKDDFGFFSFFKTQEGLYYKLPNAVWPQHISVNTLYDQGIPHRERYPADAIIMLKSNPQDDFKLQAHLDKVITEKKVFNPRYFNCSNFVNDALALLTGSKLKIKEFIPFSFTATPNKLCRKIMALDNVQVIKSPHDKINGSFFKERVLERKKSQSPFALAVNR